jgi:catechol 2,3-dioxygenase-like lactoylglutathione lyase family enzyme
VEFRLAENQFVSIADAAGSTIAPADGNGITLSWQVGDLAAAHRELKRQGITISPILPKWSAYVCYFHDPEGHRIELWSP